MSSNGIWTRSKHSGQKERRTNCTGRTRAWYKMEPIARKMFVPNWDKSPLVCLGAARQSETDMYFISFISNIMPAWLQTSFGKVRGCFWSFPHHMKPCCPFLHLHVVWLGYIRYLLGLKLVSRTERNYHLIDRLCNLGGIVEIAELAKFLKLLAIATEAHLTHTISLLWQVKVAYYRKAWPSGHRVFERHWFWRKSFGRHKVH